MKTVTSWQDMKPFGLEPQGTAAGSIREQFKVTEDGRKLLARFFGFRRFALGPGRTVFLPPELLVPLALFALAGSQGTVYAFPTAVVAIEPSDPPDALETARAAYVRGELGSCATAPASTT